jgi:hypothetical protein
MAMPATPAAVPPQAAGATLPTFMAPQGGGAIANMESGLYGQSVDRFRELASMDATHMAQLYPPPHTTTKHQTRLLLRASTILFSRASLVIL